MPVVRLICKSIWPSIYTPPQQSLGDLVTNRPSYTLGFKTWNNNGLWYTYLQLELRTNMPILGGTTLYQFSIQDWYLYTYIYSIIYLMLSQSGHCKILKCTHVVAHFGWKSCGWEIPKFEHVFFEPSWVRSWCRIWRPLSTFAKRSFDSWKMYTLW